MSEQMDTFADATPIEVPTATEATTTTAPEVDTFENTTPIVPEAKEGEGEKQEQAEEAEKAEDTKVEGETGKLDQQEKEPESDEDPDDGAEGKDGEDKATEEAEPDKSETPGDKPKGKTIRLKEGDEKYDISPDATVPVKVKGKKEFVSLDELRSNYSGQKAWSEEMAAVKQTKAEQEAQIEEFQAAKESTKAHFAKIGGMLEDAFSNPEADPLAAMKYLVELGGHNVLEFEQRLMQHYTGVVSSFDQMDEAEQGLYWAQRENELLRSNQTTRAKAEEERRTLEERSQKSAEVREKFGISEADFEATRSEIGELGHDVSQVSDEQVAKWAALKPHVARSEELCEQFDDDLTTDQMNSLITGAAQTMFDNPKMDEIDCLHFAAKRLGFKIETEDDLVSSLKEKTEARKPQKTTPVKSSYKYGKDDEGVESFDDYNNEIYARR